MTRLIQVQLATVHESWFSGKLNKTYLSLFLAELKTYHLSYYIHKTWRYWHCWPSSMQDACQIWTSDGPAHHCLCGSVVDWSERGIRRKVQFLMGTPLSFLCPTFVTRRKTSSYISLPSSKLTIFHILFINPLIPEWPTSNFSFQCHPWIKHQSHENKGNDN